MSRRRGPPALKSLVVSEDDAGASAGLLDREDGFVAGAARFEAGDVTVDERGVTIKDVESDTDKHLRYEDLEILRDLGSGASSTVKLARHKPTGTLYALKCIQLFMKAMRDQLLAELRTLFKSDCDALIEFHGAFYREGSVAVALEYMDLGGLDNIIKRVGKIPEKVLAAMTYQMLWGLGYLAHERRIHRDIKPMNVLVNTMGQVKLTDFGLSRELSTAVLAKTFVGSFKYMSPERMQSIDYNYSSDVWSLGLIVVECATGEYPYPEGKSHIDYVTIVTDGDSPCLPDGDEFSPEMHDFVAQCLDKDPNLRSDAMTLLDSPWLTMHGAVDLDVCVEIVRVWLDKEDIQGMPVDPPGEDGEVGGGGGGGGY